jgi:hypothetical protein
MLNFIQRVSDSSSPVSEWDKVKKRGERTHDGTSTAMLTFIKSSKILHPPALDTRSPCAGTAFVGGSTVEFAGWASLPVFLTGTPADGPIAVTGVFASSDNQHNSACSCSVRQQYPKREVLYKGRPSVIQKSSVT